jgi:hypothetical protein
MVDMNLRFRAQAFGVCYITCLQRYCGAITILQGAQKLGNDEMRSIPTPEKRQKVAAMSHILSSFTTSSSVTDTSQGKMSWRSDHGKMNSITQHKCTPISELLVQQS